MPQRLQDRPACCRRSQSRRSRAGGFAGSRGRRRDFPRYSEPQPRRNCACAGPEVSPGVRDCPHVYWRDSAIAAGATIRCDNPGVGITDLNMSDWLHNLPIVWMALVVFGFTYLLAAGTYGLIRVVAKDERAARAFKAIAPAMLTPLGIIFGLFVAFTAAQVWADNQRANAAVDRE